MNFESSRMSASPRSLLKEAAQLEKEGQYQKSIDLYNEYIKFRPGLKKTIQPSIVRCLNKANQLYTSPPARQVAQPEISIIIPCFNSEKYLDQCITSIRNQKIRDIEIIIVNDGSTDGTGRIIEKHKSSDDRILVISNDMPSGSPGVPRNQAIKIAKGHYIGFVDSDDWIEDDYFEEMIDAARKNHSDLVIAKGHKNLHPDNSATFREYQHFYFKDPSKTPSTFHSSSMIWDKIYRRSLLLDNSIFLGTGKAAVDVIFVLKAYFYCNKPTVCDALGYNYRRETENSVTVNQRKKSNCEFELDAYTQSLEWAQQKNIPSDYQVYIQIKQFTSFIYTLKLVNANYFKDYFYQCSKRIKRYNRDSIKEGLINSKQYYLWEDYELLSHGDLKGFTNKHRSDLTPYLIKSDQHILPKTLFMPSARKKDSILFFPDWSFSNPYQKMLYQGLLDNYDIGSVGLDVHEVNDFNLDLLSDICNTIHLHWTHPFTKGKKQHEFFDLLNKQKNSMHKRILWTVHNIVPHDCDDIKQEIDIRKNLAEICTLIICHSHAAKAKICATYCVKESKVKVLPHGLYKPYLTEKELIDSSRLSNQHRNLRLLVIGDLRPYKNVEWTIDFMESINSDYSIKDKIHLHICGKPYSDEQDRFIKSKAASFQWLFYRSGRLSDREFTDTMLETDFVFLPYKRILTSGISLNSLSHAKPFIAPYSDELQELGDDSCKLLYHSELALSDTLKHLATLKVSGKIRETYGPLNIRRAVSHLAWENVLSTRDAYDIFTC